MKTFCGRRENGTLRVKAFITMEDDGMSGTVCFSDICSNRGSVVKKWEREVTPLTDEVLTQKISEWEQGLYRLSLAEHESALNKGIGHEHDNYYPLSESESSAHYSRVRKFMGIE